MTINLEDIKKITELEDAGYEVETVLDLYITVYKGGMKWYSRVKPKIFV